MNSALVRFNTLVPTYPSTYFFTYPLFPPLPYAISEDRVGSPNIQGDQGRRHASVVRHHIYYGRSGTSTTAVRLYGCGF